MVRRYIRIVSTLAIFNIAVVAAFIFWPRSTATGILSEGDDDDDNKPV
jgi:hypothetical protein